MSRADARLDIRVQALQCMNEAIRKSNILRNKDASTFQRERFCVLENIMWLKFCVPTEGPQSDSLFISEKTGESPVLGGGELKSEFGE